jgi:putative protein-disulfide isomerase
MKLIYVVDPMCSWCWAFKPQLAEFLNQHPELDLQLILGGLAPDSDAPMPATQRSQIEQIWHKIAQQTGVEFNHQFWRENSPRRSTYPACRAVIAAEMINGLGHEMLGAIQQAYYLKAQNPSDTEVLVALARTLGMNPEAFERALISDQTHQEFDKHLRHARSLGVSGFPALLVQLEGRCYPLALGYSEADRIENRWQQFIQSEETLKNI